MYENTFDKEYLIPKPKIIRTLSTIIIEERFYAKKEKNLQEKR